MKILIVNVNSHIESTGKIVYGLYNYLKLKGNEVRLCYRGIREPKLDDANIIPLSNIKLSPDAKYITGIKLTPLLSEAKILEIILLFFMKLQKLNW